MASSPSARRRRFREYFSASRRRYHCAELPRARSADFRRVDTHRLYAGSMRQAAFSVESARRHSMSASARSRASGFLHHRQLVSIDCRRQGRGGRRFSCFSLIVAITRCISQRHDTTCRQQLTILPASFYRARIEPHSLSQRRAAYLSRRMSFH